MITVAHILPTSYLQNTEPELNNTHLLLAHRVLNDKEYVKFYKKRQQEGDYIILDNSAFELGAAIQDELLLRAIELVQPDEVVLPDVLLDPVQTLERIEHFLKDYSHLSIIKGVKLMGVPHGKTLEKYIECYKTLSAFSQIHTMGIGAAYNKLPAFTRHDKLRGRELIFQVLTDRRRLSKKHHHLLGLSDSGNLELQRLCRYGSIRSCDSSAAFICALHGKRLTANGEYIKYKSPIDFEAPINLQILNDVHINMNILKEAGQCHKEV